jgi:hypothetical protein
MIWALAHRPRDAQESTPAQVEADTSWAAVEKLQAEIPEDHLVLFVRRVA